MIRESLAESFSERQEELREVEIPEINWYEAMSEEERQKYDEASNYGCF